MIAGSTAQKMKFFIKDFFRKCDQICSFLQFLIFCAVFVLPKNQRFVVGIFHSFYLSSHDIHLISISYFVF